MQLPTATAAPADRVGPPATPPSTGTTGPTGRTGPTGHPAPVDVDAARWDRSAHEVAAADDPAQVVAVLRELAPLEAAQLPDDAPLVVLQRAFGRLHRAVVAGQPRVSRG